MTNISSEDLPVIEVPPELRGLSDAEILALNPVKEEKRDRCRPSKKDRVAQKAAKEQEKIHRIAAQYESRASASRYPSRPMPKMSDFENARKKPVGAGPVAASRLPKPKNTLFVPSQMKKAPTMPDPLKSLAAKPVVSAQQPRQSSGRVLVGSFGGAKFGAAKTQIISEDELAKKRAAEEARRQHEIARRRAIEAARPASNPVSSVASALSFGVSSQASSPKLSLDSLFKPGSPLSSVPLSPEDAAAVPVAPVKRKRGRPRKYPRPEDLLG